MRTLEGKSECFWIFYDANMSTKSKTDSEFSRVSFGKFRKTWQTDSKYFTLVGARFTGKSIGPVFSQR